MLRQTLYLWKQAPFIRLLIPLAAGILLQWYTAAPALPALCLLPAAMIALLIFNSRLSFKQFHFGWLNGLLVNTLLMALGMLLCWYKDGTHHPQWLNRYYQENNIVVATLQEPLSEKANSFKAIAAVETIVENERLQPVSGNIIIYFKKDSSLTRLDYGTRILFRQTLQPIKNTGNPGAFNYEQYTYFQGIYRQVYLQPTDFSILPGPHRAWLKNILLNSRKKVLAIISRYIPGPKEAGLAQALLIGYKDDLDKTLVQSYSNTGVVHVIAISGMHLGLIYWLLSLLFAPLKKTAVTRWMPPLFIIAGLWLFALVTGGGPSILRAAVMFTCIVLGESLARKTFIYNSLAASAFILLCIHPYWLWDAGFQLSYAAVLSIVVFMKPIYHWLYFDNKLVDAVWKLVAITLAAQVLTTPFAIYHFHQFPVYFLFTNLVAVPLSSIVILLEIVLCAVSPVPAVAVFTGQLLQQLIEWMNQFIEYMEAMPLAVWNGLQLNAWQVLLLYGSTAGVAGWMLHKNRVSLMTGLCCLLAFFSIRSWLFIHALQQQQLIVYNIPKHSAIDFIQQRQLFFTGDAAIDGNDYLQQFYLQPSRTLHRVSTAGSLPTLVQAGHLYLFNGKKIAVIDNTFTPVQGLKKINADLLILSGSVNLQLQQLTAIFNCRQVVLDASCQFYKVNKWKAEAAKLGLSCFSTVDNGAFVMKMD
jgi:competence protein ComEC